MSLSNTQLRLMITGDIIMTIGLFIVLFSHLHKDEHSDISSFQHGLKISGVMILVGLILVLSAKYTTKKDAKKQQSIDTLVLTLGVISLYLWGTFKNEDPTAMVTLSAILALFTGVSINISLWNEMKETNYSESYKNEEKNCEEYCNDSCSDTTNDTCNTCISECTTMEEPM